MIADSRFSIVSASAGRRDNHAQTTPTSGASAQTTPTNEWVWPGHQSLSMAGGDLVRDVLAVLEVVVSFVKEGFESLTADSDKYHRY